jgi:hypothetical protein
MRTNSPNQSLIRDAGNGHAWVWLSPHITFLVYRRRGIAPVDQLGTSLASAVKGCSVCGIGQNSDKRVIIQSSGWMMAIPL